MKETTHNIIALIVWIFMLILVISFVYVTKEDQINTNSDLQNVKNTIMIQSDKINNLENKLYNLTGEINHYQIYYDDKIRELEEETKNLKEFHSPEELHEEEEVIPIYETPRDIEYIVKAGDNPWKIARKVYGDGSRYNEILSYNNLTTKSMLHPGDVLKIHFENQLQEDIYDFSEELKDIKYQDGKIIDLNDNTIPELDTSGGGKNYTAEVDTNNYELLGSWRITGYDPYCSHCCGKTNGITASGNQVEVNFSCGNNDLEFGTILYIEGYGYYRVDDRGGSSHNHIDVACSSHAECYKMTNNNVNVYKVKEP